MIPIPRDFCEFIGLLNERRVRYLVRNKRASGRDKDKLDLQNLPRRPA